MATQNRLCLSTLKSPVPSPFTMLKLLHFFLSYLQWFLRQPGRKAGGPLSDSLHLGYTAWQQSGIYGLSVPCTGGQVCGCLSLTTQHGMVAHRSLSVFLLPSCTAWI